MKKIIRLTESDLHKIVRESVKRIVREGDWNTGDPYEDYMDREREENDPNYEDPLDYYPEMY